MQTFAVGRNRDVTATKAEKNKSETLAGRISELSVCMSYNDNTAWHQNKYMICFY